MKAVGRGQLAGLLVSRVSLPARRLCYNTNRSYCSGDFPWLPQVEAPVISKTEAETKNVDNFTDSDSARIPKLLHEGQYSSAVDLFTQRIQEGKQPSEELITSILSTLSKSDPFTARETFQIIPKTCITSDHVCFILYGFLSAKNETESINFFSCAKQDYSELVDSKMYHTFTNGLVQNNWNQLLKSFIQTILAHVPLDHTEKLKLGHKILHYYKTTNQLQEAESLTRKAKEHGIDLAASSRTSTIAVKLKQNNVAAAHEELQNMIDSNIERNAVTYNCFMSHFFHQRDQKTGLHYFSLMKKDNIKPSEFTVTLLIRQASQGAFHNLPNEVTVPEILTMVEEHALDPPVDYYHSLALYYGKTKKMLKLSELRATMDEKFKNHSFFSRAISGLCRAKMIKEADKLMQEAFTLRAPIDRPVFFHLLSQFVKSQNIARTFEMILNARTHKVFLSADEEQVTKLLCSVLRLPPRGTDQSTLCAENVLKIFTSHSWTLSGEMLFQLARYALFYQRIDIATQILGYMKSNNIPRSHNFLSLFVDTKMRNSSSSFSITEAVDFMTENGSSLEPRLIEQFTVKACKTENIRELRQCFDEMNKTDSKHSQETYNKAIQCCFRTKNTDFGAELMNELSTKWGTTPNTHTFNCMLHCFVDQKNIVKCRTLFEFMKEKNFHINPALTPRIEAMLNTA